MIASVSGTVAHTGLDRIVVEVGGVGILVHTTPATAAGLRRGATATLSTSLVVREDSLTLYGFADTDARDLFETVLTVSGVGPRLALALLAVHAPATARLAISSGDLTALTKVPGIGRKGAERLVLELRDKVGVPDSAAGVLSLTEATAAWRGQVREALVGLGWTARQAEEALETVAPQAAEGATVSALLRAALQVLGR